MKKNYANDETVFHYEYSYRDGPWTPAIKVLSEHFETLRANNCSLPKTTDELITDWNHKGFGGVWRYQSFETFNLARL